MHLARDMGLPTGAHRQKGSTHSEHHVCGRPRVPRAHGEVCPTHWRDWDTSQKEVAYSVLPGCVGASWVHFCLVLSVVPMDTNKNCNAEQRYPLRKPKKSARFLISSTRLLTLARK